MQPIAEAVKICFEDDQKNPTGVGHITQQDEISRLPKSRFIPLTHERSLFFKFQISDCSNKYRGTARPCGNNTVFV